MKLTVKQLRETIREAVEDYVPNVGDKVDVHPIGRGTIEKQLDELWFLVRLVDGSLVKRTALEISPLLHETVNNELMKDVIASSGKENEKEADFVRGDMSWDFADDDWDTLVSKELQKQGLMLADEDNMLAEPHRVNVGDDEYEVYVVPMPKKRVH